MQNIKASKNGLRRTLFAVTAALALWCGDYAVAAEIGVGGKRDIKVMTQNVFIGAELDSIAAATDPEQIPFLVAQTLGRIVATDFPARAGAIAQEIVNEQPDVVCLQEVTLFQTQSPGDFLAGNPVPASTEILDYLQLIHDAVAVRGAHYDVFAAVANWEVELPMIAFTETGYQLDDLRATDFDVILVRSDLPPGQLRVVGSNSGNFVAALPLSVAGATVQFIRGWCSVDLDIRGRDVRIVNTHLESIHPYFRTVQAMELVAGVASGTGNLVCAGDFNSDPAFPAPEAYGVMVAAGFANAWARLHPADPGYTWGQAPDLLNATSTLNEQDDHIWFRGLGLSATETHLVGNSPTDRVSSIMDPTRLLWPSDHAGVVATLRLK